MVQVWALHDDVFHCEAFLVEGSLVFSQLAGRPGGAGVPEVFDVVHGADLRWTKTLLDLGLDPRSAPSRLGVSHQAAGWTVLYETPSATSDDHASGVVLVHADIRPEDRPRGRAHWSRSRNDSSLEGTARRPCGDAWPPSNRIPTLYRWGKRTMSGTLIVSPVEWLLDEVAIIAAHHESESELGAAALATHAVLAHLPTDGSDRDRLRHRVATLARQHASAFREQDGDLLRAVDGEASGPPRGVPCQPDARGERHDRGVASAVGRSADRHSSGNVESLGAEGCFPQAAQAVLGSHAVAPGHEHQLDSSSALRDVTSLVNQNGSRRSTRRQGPRHRRRRQPRVARWRGGGLG